MEEIEVIRIKKDAKQLLAFYKYKNGLRSYSAAISAAFKELEEKSCSKPSKTK